MRLRDFDAAVRLAPEWDLTHINRGMLAMFRSDWPAAVEAYTTAIALLEGSGRAVDHVVLARMYGNRGYAHASMGDVAGARHDLTRARALDPNFSAPRSR